MGQKRNQPIWDSVKFKGAVANSSVEFFQTPLGGTGTTSEAVPASYKKLDYHSNNKLAGVTEQGQILKIKGVGVKVDSVDPDVWKKVLLDTQGVLEIIVKEQTVFRLPLHMLVSNSHGIVGLSAATTYVSQVWSKPKDYYEFEDVGIQVDPQTTFKVKITFYQSLADMTSYVNLCATLYGVEERN